MDANRDFIQFVQQFRAEILEKSQGEINDSGITCPDFKENIFTLLVKRYLTEEFKEIDDAEVCYFSRRTLRGSIKINGYYISEDGDEIDLFISHYTGNDTISTVNKSELLKLIGQAVRFFLFSINDNHDEMEPSSDQYSMVQRLYEVRNNVDNLDVYLLVDGVTPNLNQEELFPNYVRGNYNFRFHVWDLQRIFRRKSSNLPYDSIKIDLRERFGSPLSCLQVINPEVDYEAFLTVIPGDLLYQLYDEFGSRLLELNVRSFLQVKGKVNKGIRETIQKEPQWFLAYNNGICATAEKVDISEDGNQLVINSIRGLQIVNGGQTVASIHRAKKIDGIDLSNIYVQAKITVIDPEKLPEIAPKISHCSNSQNKVSDADFSSNDSYHVELQRLAEVTWVPGEQTRWFYERTRGQYQVAKSRESVSAARKRKFEEDIPSQQVISKTDIAKYLNTWEQLPYIVSRGEQKNYVYFIDKLKKQHESGWCPDSNYYKDVIAKAILFKSMQKIVKELDIPSFKANVVTYTLAYLSYRSIGRIDLGQIWNVQKISKGIDSALRQWAIDIKEEIEDSGSGDIITEWCKKEECWGNIKRLDLPIPEELTNELSMNQSNQLSSYSRYQKVENLNAEDIENITMIMQKSVSEWMEILSWGSTNNNLDRWQCGLIQTISSYAATGWEKKPTIKQARYGAEIINLYNEHINN